MASNVSRGTASICSTLTACRLAALKEGTIDSVWLLFLPDVEFLVRKQALARIGAEIDFHACIFGSVPIGVGGQCG